MQEGGIEGVGQSRTVTGIRWATLELYSIRLRFAYGIGVTRRQLFKKQRNIRRLCV